MKKLIASFLLFLFLICTLFASHPSDDYSNNWPQWRGPLATGEAPHGNPPVEWSETKNIRWKTSIPGRGHATPVVWDDKLFVLTAVDTGNKTGSGEEASCLEPRPCCHTLPQGARRGKKKRRPASG